MGEANTEDLEEFTRRAERILEDFQPSRLLTIVLECPQSPEQSCLAPAYRPTASKPELNYS